MCVTLRLSGLPKNNRHNPFIISRCMVRAVVGFGWWRLWLVRFFASKKNHQRCYYGSSTARDYSCYGSQSRRMRLSWSNSICSCVTKIIIGMFAWWHWRLGMELDCWNVKTHGRRIFWNWETRASFHTEKPWPMSLIRILNENPPIKGGGKLDTGSISHGQQEYHCRQQSSCRKQ